MGVVASAPPVDGTDGPFFHRSFFRIPNFAIHSPFLNWPFPNTDGAILDHIHFAIRKSGHLMEYAVLAWLWFFGLTRWSKEIPWRMQKIAIVSGLICLIFAISDEVHQSMTSFSGQPTDVALDVLGASSHAWLPSEKNGSTGCLSAPAHAPLLLAFRSRNLAGKTLCLPPYIWWSACLLSQFAFIARRPWRELAMAGLLLMGSGGILFCIHSLPLHPSDLRHFELRNAQQVTLRGQIEATPKRHIRSDPAGSKIWFETDMEASALFGTEGWQPGFGKVRPNFGYSHYKNHQRSFCLHPRNAQTPFTTPGAPRPKQRPIFSNVRVFKRSWKSIQSRIGKSFLHPTRAGSTFLRSCKKRGEPACGWPTHRG